MTRAVAVRVLRDVERRRGFSNRILHEHLERHASMAPRDRGLVTTLVYGVLRHRARLDAHIDAHARKPAGLRGEVREVLRCGALELLELGRPLPIAAAEAGKALARLDGAARLGSVAHAVLSAIDRTGAELDAEFDAASDLVALERRWSIPRWLGGRWLKHLGPDRARRRARACVEIPAVDLRVDVTRASALELRTRLEADHPGIAITQVEGQPQALRTRGGGDLFYAPAHEAGLCSVQGIGAQQPAIMLAPAPGSRVLDACAGMGVKSLQLAELMERRGCVVAADLSARALADLARVRARGGLDRAGFELAAVEGDLTQTVPVLDEEPFDAVLLDAPCTGLGNLARHPEIRWHRAFDDIADRARLQQRLLRRCLTRVRPGGRLVYAVCSAEPEEGPRVVEAVLSEARGDLVTHTTLTPEDDATEGFYAARIDIA